MRVLYTGADGYIGAVLGPKLLDRGHDAIGMDTGLYRRGWLFDDGWTRPMVISKDVRQLSQSELTGIDAVVHLAELSNDPLGENDPEITMEINHRGSVEFARKCKAAGVARFVYASSCSIYGAAGAELKSETSIGRPADGLCPMQGAGRARTKRNGGLALHAGILAQRHGVRRVATATF